MNEITQDVADWNTVLQYIRQHGYWHLLNKAVNKKAVEDILEETKERQYSPVVVPSHSR